MNRIAAHPRREMHVFLDNPNNHKPKRDCWLARHKNVHLHYRSTRVSWLNQVECWFSIPADQAFQGASFAVDELRRHSDAIRRELQRKRSFLRLVQAQVSNVSWPASPPRAAARHMAAWAIRPNSAT